MKNKVARKAAAWGEAHVQESNASTYDLAAEIHRTEYDRRAEASILAQCEVSSESEFRCALREAGFDAARIDREVRRVRGLAEGRLVRETSERFGIQTAGGGWADRPTMTRARRDARMGRDNGYIVRAVRVRVTRIRRAP